MHLSADAPRFHVSRVTFAEAPFTVGMRRATILAFVPVEIIFFKLNRLSMSVGVYF